MAQKSWPGDSQPWAQAISHNGTDEEALTRWKIMELCNHWPTSRDASEWKRYRSIFAENAYVFTTWSSGRPIDKFIEISQEHMKRDRIMHRMNGGYAEVNLAKNRAVGKMKATITQRFSGIGGGGDCDVDCDSRFIFFCERTDGKNWKAKWVKLFYEKDKAVPMDVTNPPIFDQKKLMTYPEGYRYLGYAQGNLGHKINMNLPELYGKEHDVLYDAIKAWLDGAEDISSYLKPDN